MHLWMFFLFFFYYFFTKRSCPADLAVWHWQNEAEGRKIADGVNQNCTEGAKKEDKPKLFMTTFSLISDI